MGVAGKRYALAALPPGKTWCLFYRRLSGSRGPVWTDAENLALPTGIRFPDRQAATPTVLSRPTRYLEYLEIFFFNVMLERVQKTNWSDPQWARIVQKLAKIPFLQVQAINL